MAIRITATEKASGLEVVVVEDHDRKVAFEWFAERLEDESRGVEVPSYIIRIEED